MKQALYSFGLLIGFATLNVPGSAQAQDLAADLANATAAAHATQGDSLLADSNKLRTSTKLAINLNQASFSSNWKAGGTNSIALGSAFNGRLAFRRKKHEYLGETNLEYGLQRIKTQSVRKTADRIYIDLRYNRILSPLWRLFGSVNLQSQFDVGYRYDSSNSESRTPISRFLSPGYAVEALGVEYDVLPFFKLQFGAGAVRQTVVLDTTLYHGAPSLYGVPYRQGLRWQGGFQFIALFDHNIAENLNLKWRLQAFSGYENLKKIDSRLDATITAKVNRWLNVSLNGAALNITDQDIKVQYSQQLLVNILLLR